MLTSTNRAWARGAMPQKRSGEKRARQEEAVSNDEGGGQSSRGTGSKRRKECVAAKTSQALSPSQGSVAEAEDELLLPGPCLGTGSKWELRGACEASMAKMLQQGMCVRSYHSLSLSLSLSVSPLALFILLGSGVIPSQDGIYLFGELLGRFFRPSQP
jgi:hypothetical protein